METSRSFYYQYASPKTKAFVTIAIVSSFVSAATNLIDFLFGDILAIVSVIFYLGAAFTLLFYKNWMLPVAIAIYSLFFSFMLFDGVSLVVGVLNIIFGIIEAIKIRKVNAAYELLCKNGTKPKTLI